MAFHNGMLTAANALCSALALVLATVAPAGAEVFEGPTFRKGLWRFDRTLEYRDSVQRNGAIRCVDPTNAMRGIFSSPHIGNCRSDKAQRIANEYVFENRCDYQGPVRTLITVRSDESYTERNIPKASFLPIDTVTAQRLGDCSTTE